MRTRSTHTAALALVIAALASSDPATARPRPAAARRDRVAELEKKIDEALKASADLSSVNTNLQRLLEEVRQLKAQLRRRLQVERGYKALRGRYDALEEQLGDLELRLAAMAMQGATTARSVGFDRGGFYLRGADSRFLLRVNGLLQPYYVGRIVGQARKFDGSRLGDDRSAFRLRRVRLSLGGHIFDHRLRYVLGFEFGELVGRQNLLDGFIDIALHRLLTARIGLFRQPFGRQFNLSVSTMLFHDRGPVTLDYYPGRELGVMLSGDLLSSDTYGVFSYQLGLFNGSDAEAFDDLNSDFLYTARLLYQPLGALGDAEGDHHVTRGLRIAIGASVFYDLAPTDASRRAGETDPDRAARLDDQDDDGDVDNVGILGIGVELALSWRGLSAQSELFVRREDPGAVGDPRTFWGTYTQLAFFHKSGYEGGARYSFWQNQRFGDDGRLFEPKESHQLAGVVTRWFWRDRIKLQLEYTHSWLSGISDLLGTVATDPTLGVHEVRIQAQLAF